METVIGRRGMSAASAHHCPAPYRLFLALLVFLVLLNLLPGFPEVLGAQNGDKSKLPVIAILPFEGERADQETRNLLEAQALSAVINTGDYRVISQEKRDEILQQIAFSQTELGSRSGRLTLGRQLSANGLISGQIGKNEENFYITLNLIKTITGEVLRSQTSRFSSLEEMIDGMPGLTLTLFGYQRPAESPGDVPGANQGLAAAAGRWQGDKGVERVVLNPDGTGRAVMQGGSVMELRCRYQNGRYIITQDQPNRIDFYTGLVPMDVASRLKREARPMEWVMELSPDGRRLEGTKYTTSFVKERGIITQVDNSYQRDALWLRAD